MPYFYIQYNKYHIPIYSIIDEDSIISSRIAEILVYLDMIPELEFLNYQSKNQLKHCI